MPVLRLSEDAVNALINYRWDGNVRQLKNITEQISIIEKERNIDAVGLLKYLPVTRKRDLPVLYKNEEERSSEISERDLLYKVLFDMKNDINELKTIVGGIIKDEGVSKDNQQYNKHLIDKLHENIDTIGSQVEHFETQHSNEPRFIEPIQESEIVEESLSIQDKEIDLIKKALSKYHGKRKKAANELGISERTLYRKIKEYDIT
jgi:transcriptional regulator with PAS, ATPase and Fis domain